MAEVGERKGGLLRLCGGEYADQITIDCGIATVRLIQKSFAAC